MRGVGTVIVVLATAACFCTSCDKINDWAGGPRGGGVHGDIRQDGGYVLVRYYVAPPPSGVALLVVTGVPHDNIDLLWDSGLDALDRWYSLEAKDRPLMKVRPGEKVVWRLGEEEPRKVGSLTERECQILMERDFYTRPVAEVLSLLAVEVPSSQPTSTRTQKRGK